MEKNNTRLVIEHRTSVPLPKQLLDLYGWESKRTSYVDKILVFLVIPTRVEVQKENIEIFQKKKKKMKKINLFFPFVRRKVLVCPTNTSVWGRQSV